MFEDSVRESYLENVKAIMRCALVAITICSWIAVTNHCAFAAAAKEIARIRAVSRRGWTVT